MNKILFISLSFFFLLSIRLFSQSAADYSFSTSTGVSAITPSGGWTQIIAASGGDDVVSTVRSIGFNFVYEGTIYTQFSVNSNGLMRLGSTVITTDFSNDVDEAANEPKLMPYWDDQSAASDGGVQFGVDGSAPNRICVVDFKLDGGTTGGITDNHFQVRLYETSNAIEFLYNSGANESNFTIGIGGIINTNYMARNHSTNHTCANSGGLDDITTWPGNGRLYTFTPPVANDATSTIEAGAFSEPSEINSITNDSDPEKLAVFDFALQDPGSGDALNTIIDQIVISQGSVNAIADWTDVIGGATLSGVIWEHRRQEPWELQQLLSIATT